MTSVKTQIHIVPILEDNYAYVLRSSDGVCAVIDAGESDGVLAFLRGENLRPDMIISTHHHWDHVNGNEAISAAYGGVPIYVPGHDAHKIKHYTHVMRDGDILEIGSARVHVILTAGHTMGGVCLWMQDENALFTADTVFSMGCGRLFEGSAQDMFGSFAKIAALPDKTMIYCGHEYTLMNGRFARSCFPDDADIQARLDEAQDLRARGLPTIPVLLGTEKKTNPFFKAKTPEEFATFRELRNNFK